MSMFPDWFGLQKMTEPDFDASCQKCKRRYKNELSPDECPYCGAKREKVETQRRKNE